MLWEKESPVATPDAPSAQWTWQQKDLTDLLPDSEANGLQRLTYATDISNTGWITAKGVDHEGKELEVALYMAVFGFIPVQQGRR
ncbi:MAG: hypothetical protein AAGA18_05755 [Verrucomicrobiota bacterium]